MKYACNLCNYKTNDRRLWYSHRNSQKHIKNITQLDNSTDKTMTKKSEDNPNLIRSKSLTMTAEKEHICEHCHELFTLKSNLSRHLKYCKKNKYNLLQDEYEKYKQEKELEIRINKDNLNLKHENDILKEKLKSSESEKLALQKQYETHIETLKNENKFQKQLIESAGGMIKKSMNTMSYLLLNYNEAPQLKALNDYSIISKNTNTLIENLIHYHKKGKFDKYLGDFLVQQYKKDDPKLQTLWSSDSERLNYFIRELINNNSQQNKDLKHSDVLLNKSKKELSWFIDKKGLKVKKNIIDPLLEYIYDIGVKYLNEKNKEIEHLDTENATKLVFNMQEIGQINHDIRNNTVSNNINKYIAPHFYLNKD